MAEYPINFPVWIAPYGPDGFPSQEDIHLWKDHKEKDKAGGNLHFGDGPFNAVMEYNTNSDQDIWLKLANVPNFPNVWILSKAAGLSKISLADPKAVLPPSVGNTIMVIGLDDRLQASLDRLIDWILKR